MIKYIIIGVFTFVFFISCSTNVNKIKSTQLENKQSKTLTVDVNTSRDAEEDELLKLYSAIFKISDERYDEKEAANELFRKKLIKYASANPKSITSEFENFADQDIRIITSDDKLFKIYSWNTNLGGTMHNYASIIQYKSGDKLIVLDQDDESPLYFDIITVNGANNQTYYLAISNSMFSTKDGMQSVKGFIIDNGKLDTNIKLFKTKTTILNNINVNYDFFSVLDHQERPIRLIKYDQRSQILMIPIVRENGEVTKKYLNYQFDGNQFVYID